MQLHTDSWGTGSNPWRNIDAQRQLKPINVVIDTQNKLSDRIGGSILKAALEASW